jgi:SAM-dependent methyltransferase
MFMDESTLKAYNERASFHAARMRVIAPNRVHALALRGFHPGAPTADVGCGSGRDTAWLLENGFAAVGYDASPGMLAEARAAYPQLDLREAALPALDGVPDASFDNLLCNAVLMHLPAAQLPVAAASIARVLRPGGRLVVAIRRSQEGIEREGDGRLFTPIDRTGLEALLAGAGITMLEADEQAEEVRKHISWLVALGQRR